MTDDVHPDISAGTNQGRTPSGWDAPGTHRGTHRTTANAAPDQLRRPDGTTGTLSQPLPSSTPGEERGYFATASWAAQRASQSSLAWLHELLDLIGSGDAGGRRRLRQCPSHPDGSPSLSLRAMDDGVSVKCFAGCSTEDVMAALRCSPSHLFQPAPVSPREHHRTWRSGWPAFPAVQIRGGHPAGAGMRLVATHLYGDGRWSLERWRHPITGSKDLRWLTRDDRGAYIPGLRGVPTAGLPLYEERQIRMAIGAGEPVVLVESESSVDALGAVGLYATTWAGGAASPPLGQLCAVLGGADVVLVPDHDEAGLACAARIAEALNPVAQLHVALPPVGQDARDLLASRGPAAFDPNTR